MCVNDLLAQGAEPLFFLDYFACGKLDVETARDGGRRHRRGLPAGRLRADRRRDGRDAGHVRRRATTTSPALPSARWSGARSCRAPTSPSGDVLIGLPSSGVHSNGYSLVRRLVAEEKLGLGRAGAVRSGDHAGRSPAGADAHLREAGAAGASARPAPSRRSRTSPAAGCRRTCRACCRPGWPRTSTSARGRRRPCSAGCSAPAISTTPRCCAPSTAASAWCWSWRRPRPTRSLAALEAAGEAPVRDRRDRARPRRQIASQGQGRGRSRALLGQAGVRGVTDSRRGSPSLHPFVRGGVGEGGIAERLPSGIPPTPSPSPQGGGESARRLRRQVRA